MAPTISDSFSMRVPPVGPILALSGGKEVAGSIDQAAVSYLNQAAEFIDQLTGMGMAMFETLWSGASRAMTFDEVASLIDGAGHSMPTAADLQSFEVALGSELPDAYRAFLLTNQGGVVRGDVHFLSGGEDAITGKLARIAGLTINGDNALRDRIKRAKDYQTPLDALSIATDPGGNDFVMALRIDRLGEIFILDHEMASYGNRVTIEAAEASGYARRLAGSFSELISPAISSR